MLLDRVSNPGPLTYESGALPIVLRGPFSDVEYSVSFTSDTSAKTIVPRLKILFLPSCQ